MAINSEFQICPFAFRTGITWKMPAFFWRTKKRKATAQAEYVNANGIVDVARMCACACCKGGEGSDTDRHGHGYHHSTCGCQWILFHAICSSLHAPPGPRAPKTATIIYSSTYYFMNRLSFWCRRWWCDDGVNAIRKRRRRKTKHSKHDIMVLMVLDWISISNCDKRLFGISFPFQFQPKQCGLAPASAVSVA